LSISRNKGLGLTNNSEYGNMTAMTVVENQLKVHLLDWRWWREDCAQSTHLG
jgi:hypothetical protein